MGDMINANDAENFRQFCEQASDTQVDAIIEKERAAGRTFYMDIAAAEKRARERGASHR